MEYVFFAGRLLLGGFFLWMGLQHLRNLENMSGFAASQGVPAPKLATAGSGVLLLVGGASVVTGIAPLLGVLALAAFLVPVTLKMHAFWAIEDPQARSLQMTQFLKNVALLGATLLLVAIEQPWPISLA